MFSNAMALMNHTCVNTLNGTNTTNPWRDQDSFSFEEQAAIEVPIIVLGFLGNGFICLAFHYYPSVRSLTNYVIVNLALADLMLITVFMLWILLFVANETSRYVYNVLVSIDVLCSSLSMMNLALVAIDRYIAVVYPLRYGTIFTKAKVKRCLVFIWTFSFIVASIAFSRQFVRNNAHRLLFNSVFMTFWATVFFVIPMCVIIFGYAKVFLAAWKQIKWIQMHTHQLQLRSKCKIIKKEIRLSLNLLIIIVPYSTMWGFYFGVTLYEAFCTGCTLDVTDRVLFVIGILPHLTAAVNPIVYIFLTKDLRKLLGKTVVALKKRLSCRRAGMIKTTTVSIIAASLEASSDTNLDGFPVDEF